MQRFKPNDASLSGNSFPIVASLRKLISYYCVTRISWLQKWMVIVACHFWCIKLRRIHDMAETSLVARDGNGNRNSSPTLLFSVFGHRGYHVYQRIWTPHVGEKATTVRKPGNEHDRSASNAVKQYASKYCWISIRDCYTLYKYLLHY